MASDDVSLVLQCCSSTQPFTRWSISLAMTFPIIHQWENNLILKIILLFKSNFLLISFIDQH